MLLMSFPEKILLPEFDEIKTRIYREVYQQKDPIFQQIIKSQILCNVNFNGFAFRC